MRIALLSVFAVIMFSSCTKKYISNPTVNQAFSAVYTIHPADWTKATDGAGVDYYYATLTVNELDNVIDQNGGVEVYLSFDPTDTDPTYETLPEVVSGVAYGSLHTTGKVTIDLRDADGTTSLTSAISQDVSVKVVLIDAAPLD